MGNCFKKKKTTEQQPPRTVYFGRERNNKKFKTNKVDTAKYNGWNFLPKSIFLQFIRPANTFYLVVAILQCFSVISSLSPVASVAPFIVVIAVSVIRQGYQDMKRHKNDKETNNAPARRLQNQQFIDCKWQDIHVGDFVKVHNDELIPADMILMHSTEENGICYVQTANLDGQRNLKNKNVFAEGIRAYPTEFESVNGEVVVQAPNQNLHDFQGTAKVESMQPVPLTDLNILLRGTMVKNTFEAVGMVVYAGMDTKIFLNQAKVRHKQSQVERKVNYIQLCLFVVLFFFCLTAALMYHRVFMHWKSRDNIFYLRTSHHWSISKDAALISLTTFLLLSFLIPISMNISMQILKTAQGDLISSDIQMSYILNHQRRYTKVLTTSIIEQLGNVEYVLSDKTGTLTSNTMEFKYIWVEGRDYTADYMIDQKYTLLKDPDFIRMWTAVVLCHDVVVDVRSNEYQGSSADQVCFLEYAKFLGFVFKKRTKVSIEVEIFNQRRVYELLLLLPFSERKMMTVVVRDIEARCVVVLTKGADSSVLACKSPNEHPQKIASIDASLQKFSKLGLRTLVFGLRVLPDAEFNAILAEYNGLKQEKMMGTLTKQAEKEKTKAVLGKLEKNLTMIGVSAIEDKLQDGVPQTIKRLQQADIKVVMITGDKLETAENIGYLSNFVNQTSTVYRIRNDTPDYVRQVTQIHTQLTGPNAQNADITVLIEGNAIGQIIQSKDKNFIKMFTVVVSKCKSLIFCRSTPAQKGHIVKFFKDKFKKTVLGIGDGGNDVPMIQQADIGVGILGKEGNQAAAASDFNFCQFRFLDRLLFHHGRWAYWRIAYFFVYYGFKNLVVTMILFYFLAYCGWSGKNLLSSAYLTAYNSILSVFLTIYYGVFQQDINSDMYPPAYPMQPQFYKFYRNAGLFSYFRYIVWSAMAIGTSAWIYFVTIYGLSSYNALEASGRVSDLRVFSSNMSISCFLVITTVVYLDMYNFTVVSWFTLWVLTILVAFFFYLTENFLNIGENWRVYRDAFKLKYYLVIMANWLSIWAMRQAYNTLRFKLKPNMVQKWMMRRNKDYKQPVKSSAIVGEGRLDSGGSNGELGLQEGQMSNSRLNVTTRMNTTPYGNTFIGNGVNGNTLNGNTLNGHTINGNTSYRNMSYQFSDPRINSSHVLPTATYYV